MITLCTLCGGGKVHWQYLSSFYKEMYEQPKGGLVLLPATHTDISKGRDILTAVALSDPACTHILWMDADQAWKPGIAKRLLSHEKDIVSVAIRKKKPEVEWCHIPKNDGRQEGELIQSEYAGTGAMLVRRQVYEKIASEMDDIKVNVDKFFLTLEDDVKPAYLQGFRAYHKSLVNEDGDLLGDDTAFCYRARKCGFDIWVDLGWPVYHFGEMTYYSDARESVDAVYFRGRPEA
jgi:hypothetical protein